MKKLLKESISLPIKLKVSGKIINFLGDINFKSDGLYIKFIPITHNDLDIIDSFPNKSIIIKKLLNICNLSFLGFEFKYKGTTDSPYQFYIPIFKLKEYIITNIYETSKSI